MKRTKLILLIIFVVLSIISLSSVYFTHQLPTEEEKIVTLSTYEHVGKYDYIAELKPNELYNQSTLSRDEGTLYTKIIKHINITFSYMFKCDHSTNITINYSATMDLEAPQKWLKHFTTTPKQAMNFRGGVGEFSTTFFINVTWFDELIQAIEKETGTFSPEYHLSIKPNINTVADASTSIIEESFNPTLVIKFKYRTPEGDHILMEGLEHKSLGAITQTEKFYRPNVRNQRYLSYAFSITSLSSLLYTTWVFTKSKPAKPLEKPIEEIITPHEEIIMEAAAEPTYEKQRTTIKMKTLEDLVGVADGLAKPVLYLKKPPITPSKEPTHIFYVLDGLIKYEYETTAPSRVEKEAKPEAVSGEENEDND